MNTLKSFTAAALLSACITVPAAAQSSHCWWEENVLACQSQVTIGDYTTHRLCGTSKPAPLKPVTIPVDKLLENVKDKDSLRKFLMGGAIQLDPDQMQLLMLAADPDQSAQASIVALQTGVNTGGWGCRRGDQDELVRGLPAARGRSGWGRSCPQPAENRDRGK